MAMIQAGIFHKHKQRWHRGNQNDSIKQCWPESSQMLPRRKQRRLDDFGHYFLGISAEVYQIMRYPRVSKASLNLFMRFFDACCADTRQILHPAVLEQR